MIADGLERPLMDDAAAALASRRASTDRIMTARPRVVPTQRRIKRHRVFVGAAKLLLPLGGLALLVSIAVWPEIERVRDSAVLALQRGVAVDPESGQMKQPRYRGVDERGRPYTVSADAARETGMGRLALTVPKGDLTQEDGSWLMVDARRGVYLQHSSQLDLSGEVTMYRDDGTTLRADAATIDLKSGAGASNDKTHAEGPFGVLDSQGFTLVDKGAAIQFSGPAHLVMNGSK